MTAEVKPSQFSTKNYRSIKTRKQARYYDFIMRLENESMVKYGAGRLQFSSERTVTLFHKGSKTHTQTLIDTPQTKREV